MKTKIKHILTLCFVGIIIGCSDNKATDNGSLKQSSKNENGDWIVRNRTIPIVQEASVELKSALSAIPVPDVEKASVSYPKNEKEWFSSVATTDTIVKNVALAQAEKRGVTYETFTIEGVPVYKVMPKKVKDEFKGMLFLYAHGGSYTSGRGVASLLEPVSIADYIGIEVLSIDYSMPPNSPFPTGLEEVVKVYEKLIQDRNPSTIVLGGTSAGGGMILAAVHKMKALNLTLPGALFAGTPWSDLTKTGDSYYINEGIDRVLVTYDGRLRASAEIYVGDNDFKNPLISPVYGDFNDFPPTYLVSGTRDLFLSNTVRVHRKMREVGVIADLNIYEGISHGAYWFSPDLPEAKQIYKELGWFLKEHLK